MIQNPVKQIKINGAIALFTVTVLYVLTNVAYFAASKTPSFGNISLYDDRLTEPV